MSGPDQVSQRQLADERNARARVEAEVELLREHAVRPRRGAGVRALASRVAHRSVAHNTRRKRCNIGRRTQTSTEELCV